MEKILKLPPHGDVTSELHPSITQQMKNAFSTPLTAISLLRLKEELGHSNLLDCHIFRSKTPFCLCGWEPNKSTISFEAFG